MPSMDKSTEHHPIDGSYWKLSIESKPSRWDLKLPFLSPQVRPPPSGRRVTYWALIASVGSAGLDSFGSQVGSSSKTLLLVLREFYPYVSNPNTLVHMLGTLHININQNENVKHAKIHLNVQAHLKAYLSNVMDVLGRLTSKQCENLNTANTHHYKLF